MNNPQKKKKKPFEYFVYDFIKITAAIPGLIWLRPKIWYENEEAKKKIKGGALLVSNHIGFTDVIVLMMCIWYRRHHFLCLDQFFANPVSAWLFRQFHCIPVDREKFAMSTLREIVDQLKDDRLVTMFPEGHIGTDGNTVDRFKSGMVLMAAMSKKPIVPVYIVPKKSELLRQHLVIGAPVYVSSARGAMPSLSEIEKITKELQEKTEHLANISNERRKKR